MNKNELDNPNFKRHENKLLKRILFILIIIVVLVAISIGLYFLIKTLNQNKISIKSIKKHWQEGNYNLVYEEGKSFLQDNPYNNTVLTYYGYACYELGVSQNDNFSANEYIDDAISKMRLALYEASDSLRPQLEFRLGSAYYYKTTISNYYYSDLAIKYLSSAKNHGYNDVNLNLFLGYSYASLGMHMESIAAFSEALIIRESDQLLLSIAKEYYKAKEFITSEQYLNRIIDKTSDDDILLESKLLLAQLHSDQNKIELALSEFEEILKKYKDSADAYYGLGLIYEKQNNIVKARAEWRKALRIQPNHVNAMKKFSTY